MSIRHETAARHADASAENGRGAGGPEID